VTDLPPHLYYRHGVDTHGETPTLERALLERARLVGLGTYPLLTLGHLAYETGTEYKYLREIVSRRRDPYTSTSIPKRAGGSRPISIPEPPLIEVQRWLLANVLGVLPGHPASFAYREGRSIVQCAGQHRGGVWLIKMDLHDFFGSVNEAQVFKVFRGLGYSKLVSFELSRLTTRAPYATQQFTRNTIWPYSVNMQGALPQGSPTSGQLANAAATRLDRLLYTMSVRQNLVYTRYSDDLVFSTRQDVGRDGAARIVREITRLIDFAGFAPHQKKTRVIPPGARRIVLGLLVDDTVRLPVDRRRRVELHLRGCEKFGLGSHASARGFESVFAFVDHLDGWIAFAMGVERERAMQWRRRLTDVLEREGLLALVSSNPRS
jgi:RNA-directed DNA polymerase